MAILVGCLVLALIILCIKIKLYKETAYYNVTHIPYFSVMYDAGRYGEYKIYKELRGYEQNGARFLFNVYVPKENGGTTEIDIIMISHNGIFVFESKNYSGWIFGSERNKMWYQTLPTGRRKSHKESFYNPIIQNRSHISHLKKYIGTEMPMQSIIVFSDKCTLKNIDIISDDIFVINKRDVNSVIWSFGGYSVDEVLSEQDIDEIYNLLYPCSQVDEYTKMQHIQNINDLNENFENYNIPIEHTEKNANFCPICGGKLLLRTAKKGTRVGTKFYGCENYPKCKYTENA